MRHLVPFDRTRGMARLLAMLAAAGLLVVLSMLGPSRPAPEPWRAAPASRVAGMPPPDLSRLQDAPGRDAVPPSTPE